MKLAIIGDLHYPDALTPQSPLIDEARDAYFNQFMDLFLSIDADYHISIGDLTHAGEIVEFQCIMDKIASSKHQRRFLHVLGNHDTFTYPKSDILSLTQQQRYGLIEEQEAIIILLDTAREDINNWGGTMDEEQLIWLEQQMKLKTDKPLFVFGHHPPYGTTARSTEEMMSLDPELDFWAILEQWPGAGFYFNGHNHVHSIVKRENWHFIQTAAVPDIPAVRIVRVLDDEVRVETLNLASEAFTEWASIFTESMFDYDMLSGAEGDSTADKLIVSRQQTEGKRVEFK